MFDDIKAIPMQDFIALRGHTGGILKTGRVIILNGDIGPFSPEDEAQICGFVERGGGLVCIGDAAEAYHEYPLLGEALGNIHGICALRSEIIARVVTPDHYLTRRLDPSFAVQESVYLLNGVPPDADLLWRTSWRYASYTLAYARRSPDAGTPCISSDDRSRDPLCFRCRDTGVCKACGDDWLWRHRL